jgi:60 kDa SS-A/Ro ribonucleoprotein
MVNRQVREKYSKVGKVNAPQRDTVNDHGAPAYSRTPEEDLIKFLMVGSTDNTFYVGKEENVERAVALFSDPSVSTELKAKACVYAREKGYNRELPILMLAEISKESPEMFKRIQSKVLKNPHDWDAFIDICRSGAIRNGIGRSIKGEMVKYLSQMPEYHALKYPTAVMDIINISRPNPTKIPLVAYMKSDEKENFVNGIGLDSLLAYEHSKNISDAIRSKKMPETFYKNIAGAIREYRLPYEAMTSVIGKNTECWSALLDVAPYFNMVRNLNNFMKYGAITDDNIAAVCNRIVDEGAIRKSMMYPFRFFQAAKNFKVPGEREEDEYGYPHYSDDEGTSTLNAKHCKMIKNALIKAIDVSLVNMPELPGRTAIMTDCSGSMRSKVSNDKTDITCVEVAGIYSAVLHRKCPNTVLLPFDDVLRGDVLSGVVNAKNTFEAAKAFVARGGTSMALPVLYLLERNIKVDNIVGFTDNMDWCARDRNWNEQVLFLEAFLKYRKTINPKVKAYLVTLEGYKGYPVPPEVRDVAFIYGWSDNIVELIGKDMDAQIREVRNLEI